MVTAAAPARTASVENPLALPPAPRPVAPRARPIPVAAYPAGTPRWVTYSGRRRKVVAIHDQPALDPRLDPVPFGARRLQVELACGSVLTLVHHAGGWFEGSGQRAAGSG